MAQQEQPGRSSGVPAAHVFELDDRNVVQRAVKGHVGVVLWNLGGRVACKSFGVKRGVVS